MHTVKFETTIDEAVADALPQLQPLMGRRVQVIALESPPRHPRYRPISFDEFLKHQLERPAGIEPVTLEDMEAAIARGALGEDF